ncbi:hypothetical protein [Dactylosporangium sp. NPDC051484]|uniref:hypothetical protein n=1 Tax=Dactylosporangium sp. NPDC051484 TaxID=3154942 RepID=UPI00344F31F8
MTGEEGWPRGTVGHLTRPKAALVTCAALGVIGIALAVACLALLLVIRVLA